MTNQLWSEVTVTVATDDLDAVRERLTQVLDDDLTRFVEERRRDDHVLRLYLRPDEIVAASPIHTRLDHLADDFPAITITFTDHGDRDWSSAWRDHHEPVTLGSRIIVRAPWHDPPEDINRLDIVIEPGMAFGLGTHATTRLAAKLVERNVRTGDRILDVGCGSGLLAFIALRLGATHAVACDHHYPSVRACRDNAALNDFTESIDIVHGSLDTFRGAFDLVVMNVRGEGLLSLIDIATRRDAVGRRWILSGIRHHEEHEIRNRMTAARLTVIERIESEHFVAVAACSL